MKETSKNELNRIERTLVLEAKIGVFSPRHCLHQLWNSTTYLVLVKYRAGIPCSVRFASNLDILHADEREKCGWQQCFEKWLVGRLEFLLSNIRGSKPSHHFDHHLSLLFRLVRYLRSRIHCVHFRGTVMCPTFPLSISLQWLVYV